MRARGIDPDSDEAQLFGRTMLRALTDAFGKTILGTGFFHADPHPGNIFVMDDGRVGLIDFGQVKQIGSRQSQTLSKIMLALHGRTSDTDPKQLDEIGRLALELGVELVDDAPQVGPAATAMWLFDGSVRGLT
jgi:aarF domain-containing kinase